MLGKDFVIQSIPPSSGWFPSRVSKDVSDWLLVGRMSDVFATEHNHAGSENINTSLLSSFVTQEGQILLTSLDCSE